MGRISKKENKNIYQTRREELGLSRDKASELLETITPERIEKIENEKSTAHPDEVMLMAEKYKLPLLCNYYCVLSENITFPKYKTRHFRKSFLKCWHLLIQ